jgi:hypothetical protein
VFQWNARFPLLAVYLARGDGEAALEQARAMLDPSQQPLPEDVRELVEAADGAGDPGVLARALELARAGGFA